MQNLLPCGFVIHSTSAISKPNIQGRQLNSQKHAEDVDLLMIKKYNYDVKTAFYTPLVCLSLVLQLSGRQTYANCTRVAASCMQISADFIHVACDWQPHRYNLRATGSHSSTIYIDWWPLRYNLYGTGRQSHANFACASGQLHAKPPVFKFFATGGY
jgi:hypothetical protein